MADAAEISFHRSEARIASCCSSGLERCIGQLRDHFSAPYHRIAGTLKWLTLSLFAYVITAFAVGVDWGSVLKDTLTPSVPQGSDGWAMIVAIFGTTISPYLFFWQASQEVEEEKFMGRQMLVSRLGATRKELNDRRVDVGLGIVLLELDQCSSSC